MKLSLGSGIGLLVLSLFFGIHSYQRNLQHSNEIAQFQRQVELLLADLEERNKQINDRAKETASLRTQFAALNDRLVVLQSELQKARREEKVEEQPFMIANRSNKVDLVREMSALDPFAMGELITLNSQYGEFFKTLNVSDQRFEIIVQAFSDLIAEQNQARQNVMAGFAMDMQNSRNSPFNNSDMMQQMADIHSPDAQLEALSFSLTQAELEAFEEFEDQRRAGGAFSSFTTTILDDTSGVSGGVFQVSPEGSLPITLKPIPQ